MNDVVAAHEHLKISETESGRRYETRVLHANVISNVAGFLAVLSSLFSLVFLFGVFGTGGRFEMPVYLVASVGIAAVTWAIALRRKPAVLVLSDRMLTADGRDYDLRDVSRVWVENGEMWHHAKLLIAYGSRNSRLFQGLRGPVAIFLSEEIMASVRPR